VDDVIKALAEHAAYFLEAVAVLVILGGGVRAILMYAKQCALSGRCYQVFSQTRLRLGHALSLGLEFLIGADILKSAVSPTWADLGRLAAVVAIRSAINFMLIWELRETGQDRNDTGAAPAS
jgi:uncharacterized membrane protein